MNNNKIKKILYLRIFSLLIAFLLFIFIPSSLLAQVTPEERQELREFQYEDRLEKPEKPKTADEIMELLKERAMLKIKERRKQLLLKTRVSLGMTHGFETNPANDSLEKGDSFMEETFNFNWVPTFEKWLSADVGYSLTDTNYFEQRTIDTADHSLTGSLKYYHYPSNKILLEPGIGYTWLLYDFDKTSN